jgi:hypothetical protein
MNLYGFLYDEKALAGMLYDANPRDIVSYPALEDIDFGKGIFVAGNGGVAQNKYTDKAVLDLSAYTTASKDIIVTVNGVAVTTLTTTGTIDDDIDTLVESINSEIADVIATADKTNDKVTIETTKAFELDVELNYDGSDVTSSKVTSTSDYKYVGVSVFHQTAFKLTRGLYPKTNPVAVLDMGRIWVKLANGVTPAENVDAYVTSAGVFTTESSGNTKVGVFQSVKDTSIEADGIALVDIRKY